MLWLQAVSSSKRSNTVIDDKSVLTSDIGGVCLATQSGSLLLMPSVLGDVF